MLSFAIKYLLNRALLNGAGPSRRNDLQGRRKNPRYILRIYHAYHIRLFLVWKAFFIFFANNFVNVICLFSTPPDLFVPTPEIPHFFPHRKGFPLLSPAKNPTLFPTRFPVDFRFSEGYNPFFFQSARTQSGFSLHCGKICDKIWYLSLCALAVQRPPVPNPFSASAS